MTTEATPAQIELKAHLIERGKKLALTLGKHSLSRVDMGDELWKSVMKYFQNVQFYLEACGLNRTRRPPSMNKEEMKKYLTALKVITPNGCWVTEKYYADKRYLARSVLFNGKRWPLHRLTFYIFKGDLVKKQVIMHECNNSECFNPDHLSQGSQQDNIKYSYSTGRHPKTLKGGKKIKINNEYNYKELLNYVKSNVFITDKNEWLYTGKVPKSGYPLKKINDSNYVLTRLILANKLGKNYSEIDTTRHILPDGSIPQKHDLNPDHLFEGSSSQNAKDSLAYKAGVFLSQDVATQIRKELLSYPGSKGDFDKSMAIKYKTTEESIKRVRLQITFKNDIQVKENNLV